MLRLLTSRVSLSVPTIWTTGPGSYAYSHMRFLSRKSQSPGLGIRLAIVEGKIDGVQKEVVGIKGDIKQLGERLERKIDFMTMFLGPAFGVVLVMAKEWYDSTK